jgi:serine/threonine-protein kinase RsbW
MPSTLCVSAELSNLAVIRGFVKDTAAALQIEPDAIADMLQAVEEAATNIIVHGYRGEPGEIEVETVREQAALVVRLRDHAVLFNPTRVPPPDLTLPLQARRLGGLGVHLMRHFTDTLLYRVTPDGGNELTLIRKSKSKPQMEETDEHQR